MRLENRRVRDEDVVAAGGGDLEAALGAFLALDVPHVGVVRLVRHHPGLGGRQHLDALEVVGVNIWLKILSDNSRLQLSHGWESGSG